MTNLNTNNTPNNNNSFSHNNNILNICHKWVITVAIIMELVIIMLVKITFRWPSICKICLWELTNSLLNNNNNSNNNFHNNNSLTNLVLSNITLKIFSLLLICTIKII